MLPYVSDTASVTDQLLARKQRLRKLDRLLESLEQLNLHDQLSVPITLHDDLKEEGIGVYPDSSIAELLEQVWARQEAYLNRAPERRNGQDGGTELNALFRCYLQKAGKH